MGKICIQCNSKIGFFKTAIEGVYCGYDCRNDARRELERHEAESRRLADAAHRKAEADRAERARSEAALKVAADRKSLCPKCAQPWSLVHGGGAMGLDVGDCIQCGFSAEFLKVEDCPHCHSLSLVVGPDDSGKCPRCKYRHGGYQRLTA